MKLENQVVSLELAKQLNKLGVKQDSLFYWVEHYSFVESLADNKAIRKWDIFYQYDKDDRVNEQVSAFTVAELGEMLPMEINVNTTYGLIEIEKIIGAWRVFYFSSVGMFNIHTETAKTEADARAKMLIWLIENNHISFKEQSQ